MNLKRGAEMFVTRLKLKNWRNFVEVDVPLREHTYLLGANASGKSNLLDVFRFLRDISKAQGGGLQKALHDRGGIQKLRCLHARQNPEVRIEVHLAESLDDKEPLWRYVLAFKPEGKGQHRTLIEAEEVWHGGIPLLRRPNQEDKTDPVRLTQTFLEQIQANAGFRDIADFFGETIYLHLVPQLLKFGDLIGGQRLEDDPFGQGFLERIARESERNRRARLERIEKALTSAVPHFKGLRFKPDPINGRPHLEAMHEHFRPNAGWQMEEQFSDGTLRLIALLWILQEGESLLLLEEPELSLNNAIVAQIPLLFDRIQKSKKRRARQILVSTHSEALLSNGGIDSRGVLLLEPAREGSRVREVTEKEEAYLHDGFTVGEILLPLTNPENVKQLSLWQ